MRRLCALLAALALVFAGCKARPGEGWSLDSSRKDRSSSSSKSETDEPENQDDGDDTVDANDYADIDVDAVVDGLFEEGLCELCVNYNETGFESPEDINPTQMVWSLYWMDAAINGADTEHDHDGYDQISIKRMDRLITRWFGLDAPEYVGKENVPIDKANGEAVAIDPDSGNYYIYNLVEPKEEVFSELRSAKEADGVITIRFNTKDSSENYANTYHVKVRADEDGNFYLTSFARGKSS